MGAKALREYFVSNLCPKNEHTLTNCTLAGSPYVALH